MKRGLLLVLFPMCTWAQDPIAVDKKVMCNWTKPLLENLSKKHQEEPVWLGNGEQGDTYSLFVNPNTGDWTLVQFNNEIACVIGAGTRSQTLAPRSTM
jgi:hypothetical protein